MGWSGSSPGTPSPRWLLPTHSSSPRLTRLASWEPLLSGSHLGEDPAPVLVTPTAPKLTPPVGSHLPELKSYRLGKGRAGRPGGGMWRNEEHAHTQPTTRTHHHSHCTAVPTDETTGLLRDWGPSQDSRREHCGLKGHLGAWKAVSKGVHPTTRSQKPKSPPWGHGMTLCALTHQHRSPRSPAHEDRLGL